MIGFGLPALLPLALLAALPTVIHVISRARLRRFDFPTLRLLEDVRRERVAWTRLREIILLLLRTLALLALLLALARPWLGSGTGDARPDLVLLLDDSYSMQYGPAWQRACSLARDLLRAGPPDGRVILITASAPSHRSGPTTPAVVARVLDTLLPSNTDARLVDALPAAARLADSLDARLVAISDLQRRSLSGDWSVLSDRNLLLLDAGSDAPANLVITDLSLDRPVALLDRPTTIRLGLANYGPDPAVIRVELESDGRPLPGGGLTANLPARQARSFNLETRFTRAGPVAVTARLLPGADSLEIDNARYLAVEVRDSLRVLLVASPGVTSRHVTTALLADPSGFISVAQTPREQLGRRDLRAYDVALILDALALEPGDWTRLLFGLAGGTGLVLMAGPTTGSAVQLAGFATGTGALAPAGFLTVTDRDSLHPLFSGIDPALWQAPRFRAASRLRPDSARVLARFNDGNPFLLEAGNGRVLLWATGPDAEFTDLVRRALFVPLLVSSLEHVAVRDRVQSRAVGDSLYFPAGQSGAAVLTTPATALELEPRLRAGHQAYEHHDTRLPGVYRLGSAFTAEPLALAAVNVRPEEGNLERVRPEELPGNVKVARAIDRGRDLTRFLLFVAAAAFAVELLLLL